MMTIEQLVIPITKENPVGVDLRKDSTGNALYYQIKDARNTARDLERQQMMGNADITQQPRWDVVLNLCEDVLAKKSKDLEISAWYTEALIRKQGFVGLAHGFRVTNQLAQDYWDTLYPLPDEDGFEKRLTTLMSLCGEDYEGTLVQPIYQQFITQGSSVGPFALWQYQLALDTRRSQTATGITLAVIKTAVQESTAEFYMQLEQDLQRNKAAFQALAATIASKCSTHTLVTRQITEALEKFADHLRYILKDAPFTLPTADITNLAAPTAANEVLTHQAASTLANVSITSDAMTRDDALAQLGKIAALFRRIEPQSPLPYLLDRTIYLGKLPFHELLEALVNDGAARKAAYELLGIQDASN